MSLSMSNYCLNQYASSLLCGPLSTRGLTRKENKTIIDKDKEVVTVYSFRMVERKKLLNPSTKNSEFL